MDEKIIIPPREFTVSACDHLDEAIGWVLDAISKVRKDFGRFEAPVEARVLLNLLVRATEGVITLARHDLVLLPAAFMLTRSGRRPAP